MVLHPLQALARRLHLGEVVVESRLGSDDGRDHVRCVHDLLIRDGAYPSRSAAVDVSVAHVDATRAYSDERRVAASSVHRGALGKAKLRRLLREETARLVRRPDDLRKVVSVDAEHFAEFDAPSAFAFSCVVEHCRKGAVLGHNHPARASADEIFLHIQPLAGLRESVRLVIFDPQILPHRVLDAARDSSRCPQGFDEFEGVHSRDLQASSDALFHLFGCPLVHVAHGVSDRNSVLIHEDKSLHLRAEGYAFDVRRIDARFADHPARAFAHGLPPFVGVLLGSAVREGIESVSRRRAPDHFYFFTDVEEACLDACRSYIVREYKQFHHSLYLNFFYQYLPLYPSPFRMKRTI